MELIELIFKEETETHYLFKIIVSKKGLFGGETILDFDCAKEKGSPQSYLISNGRRLFMFMLGIDDSINAILSSENKNYKK